MNPFFIKNNIITPKVLSWTLGSNVYGKDPTGFIDKDNIEVTYDAGNRTITLTHSSGKIAYLWRGNYKELQSPWTSTAHGTELNSFYLKSTDGINFIWESTIWNFYDMQVAVARYAPSTNEHYGIRECHGLMDWETHLELHDKIGTYRYSGLQIDSGSIVVNPANNAVTNTSNRPTVLAGLIKDEDLSTIIPEWNKSKLVYSILYFNNLGQAIIEFNSVDIYKQISNVIQYNPIGQGLQPVTNGNFVNMWCYHVPVTLDTHSKKYANVWIVGQSQHTTLSAAQSEDPNSIDFGNIAGQLPEQVPYAVITFQYNTGISSANSNGKCKIAANPRYLVGSRMSLIAGSPNILAHNSTLDRNSIGNHDRIIPIVDSTTAFTIYKADGTTPIAIFNSVDSLLRIDTIRMLDRVNGKYYDLFFENGVFKQEEVI